MLRYVDNNNFVLVTWQTDISVKRIKLFSKAAGVMTTLAQSAVLSLPTSFGIKIIMDGKNYVVYTGPYGSENTVVLGALDVNTQTGTKFGLAAYFAECRSYVSKDAFGLYAYLRSDALEADIVDFEVSWFLESKLVEEKKVITPEVQTSALKPSEVVKKFIAESKVRMEAKESVKSSGLAALAKDGLASSVFGDIRPKKVTAKDIMLTFMSLYKAKYSEVAPLVTDTSMSNPYAATYMYIGRAIKWSNNDADLTLKIVKFLLADDNWDKICAATSITGRPSFHLIGSSKVWPSFIVFYKEGIPAPKYKKPDVTDITKRYDPKKIEKDIGWMILLPLLICSQLM
ncbi:hypothetical protein HMI54_009650 [Coelomomyces lativittatus]|nr:hypothetical protein HMI54_009650 [Coelomomyces lativittatus]